MADTNESERLDAPPSDDVPGGDVEVEASSMKFDGVIVGRLDGFDEEGAPLVSFDGVTDSVAARTAVALDGVEGDREILIVFEAGDPGRPIVTGVLCSPTAPQVSASQSTRPETAIVDGERVVLRGTNEIVLECGKASIVLRKNGRIVIRGGYVETRSEGRNRIKGGSVEIN